MSTSASSASRVDGGRTRSALMLTLTIAQPLAGRLAEFTGRGVSIAERSRRSNGPTTPAGGAFAIWGPIFLASFALAVQGAAPGRRDDRTMRRVGSLLNLAYAANTAWSVQAQYRGLGWPSVAIIATGASAACAACAGAERASAADHRLARLATGLLAGWLTVATFANLEATLNETRGRPSPRQETRRAWAFIGMASGAAVAATGATRGNLAYAAAALWGLGGIVVRNLRERRRDVAAVAALGMAALGAVLPGTRSKRLARNSY